MNTKRILLTASMALLMAGAVFADYESGGANAEGRSAYTYIREASGEVTVISGLNGTVQARRNLPISAGDEVRTEDPARAEIALADGNLLHVGGGTQLKLSSLRAQQGSDDEVSAIDLSEGSVILSAVGNDDRQAPRIDTQDATVYASVGSRVRVNSDPRRGTSVVVRAGSVEVRTPAGSYTVRAGNYLLVQGDQEPEIARGDFSRDRFDIWAADRLEQTYDTSRSASSRYVNEDYSSDVAALDGYGDWDYNSTYSSNVWRPHVSAGWTPYSYGSWYYTPLGATWWSSDPWGWYPFHYGNWFWDVGWNSWCWSPGYLYSPAWVYWGFSGGFVGWCPVGFYSPWWNFGFPGINVFNRVNVFVSINGVFSTRRVDFRGWNFVGGSNFGVTNARMQVIPGSRIAARLGAQVAVTSRPIVVSARGGAAGVRDSLREFVRQAPRTIERTARPDSSRLEPVLARDRTLPKATIDALRERTVVAERGRLSGPGAMDVAPRGTTVVERGRPVGNTGGGTRITTDRSTGRTVIDRAPERGRTVDLPDRGARPEARRPEPGVRPQDSWRNRAGSERTDRFSGMSRPVDRNRDNRTRDAAPGGRENWRAPSAIAPRRPETSPSESWRGRVGSESAPGVGRAAPRAETFDRHGEGWRSRSKVPPARRVIEGAVPGRRAPGGRMNDLPRRGDREIAPAPREFAPRDRGISPRDRGFVPPDRSFSPRERGYSAPAPREIPQPRRDIAPRSDAPRSIERAPAPPSHSAPPRSAPAPSRGAPPSSSGKPRSR